MKKILFITSFMLIAVFAMSTTVYAAVEVTDLNGLKLALTGNETEITLKNDITITGTETLDLAGKTITAEGTIIVEGNLSIDGGGTLKSTTLYDVIIVKPGATLTVDWVNIETTRFMGAGINIYGTTGKTTLVNINKDAEIKATYAALISKPGGQGITVNIRGTMLGLETKSGSDVAGGVGFYINGFVTDTSANAPVVNVYDGAILEGDNSPAVYAAGYAVWNIQGGIFTGTEALSIKAGTFNITGGYFKATGEYINPVLPEHNGSESSGSAISMTSTAGYNAQKIELNIENATVESVNGHAILEANTDSTTSFVKNVEITGGSFTSAKAAVNAQNVTGFISGGTFSSDVDEYVDTTKTAVKDEVTGEYYVGTPVAVKVATTKNGKVTTSEAEAIEGQTVKITATPDKNYEVASIKVTDASGKEITVKNNTFTMPASEVTVTVTFKEKVKDGTPATGSMNIIMLVSAVLSAVTLSVLISKKYARNI